MRLLVYNIAYGTGCPDGLADRIWAIHRYIRTPQSHLDRIIEFIDGSSADIVALVEVDTGSFRTGYVNQAEKIASHLSKYHTCSVKYGMNSIGRMIPILQSQANAVLTRRKVPKRHFHFFPFGFKRLIIELNIEGIRFFLVHLALQRAVRAKQLDFLSKLAEGDGPLIVTGDFNAFAGTKELAKFQRKLGLANPNTKGLCTYPSWEPENQLDMILCSKEIKIMNFEVPDVRFSDHLPVLLDFYVDTPVETTASGTAMQKTLKLKRDALLGVQTVKRK